MLASVVKRFHDLDKSGWMILTLLIPIVDFVFSIYLLFVDGTIGPNRYGEDPKGRVPYAIMGQPVNITVNTTMQLNTKESEPK